MCKLLVLRVKTFSWLMMYEIRNGLYRFYLSLSHHYLEVAHEQGEKAKACSDKLHALLD